MSKKKKRDKPSRDMEWDISTGNEGIICLPGATQTVTNTAVGRGATVVNGRPLDLSLDRDQELGRDF